MRAHRLPGSLKVTLVIALSIFASLHAQTCPSASPVGISDAEVFPISSIVTSSDLTGHGKDQIRLNCCEGASGNAWCPDSTDKNPYVEIHLGKPVAIGRIVIQPPTVTNQVTEYPENFMKSFDLLFKLSGIKELATYAQDVNAIVNKTISLNNIWLTQTVVTDVIRIEPRQSEKLPCFRMELYSCDVASLCPQAYCENDGACSGPNTCDCLASFFGEKCQYTKQAIPKAVYSFLNIVENTIITSLDILTFHGEVTLDISNSLIIKPGSYIDLSSFTSSSCYADLDSCFSGFTLNLEFSFSKLDLITKVVLTNGAGIDIGIKGITLLFSQGELHCYVVTSSKLWKVIKSFSLLELSWYEISISWSPHHGLLVLQGSSLIGSSYVAETLTTVANITNNFMIGYNKVTTSAELHWKSMTIIQLFWQDVKRADLLTATTSVPTTVTAIPTNTVAVTQPQVKGCLSASPVGISDPEVIPVSRIITSSDMKDHGKDQIRLNCCEGTSGNAWCPDSTDKNPYVEIHLEKPMAIGRIVIQPPTVKNQDTEYPVNFMKSFDLFFKLVGINELATYAQDINAIVNKTISLNTIWLQHAIVTDIIRIEPRQSENLPCFRMELYTCDVASICSQGYCQNGGTCSGPNSCDCSASYFGERCQYTKQTIPKAIYSFLKIIGNTIKTTLNILTFHGGVTLDISNSLILKPGSYIDFSSLTSSSCYADLDKCFSGFTLNFEFSFSKLDTESKVVLTNGAGIDIGIKGITLLFVNGELHCYVVTSTKLWKVIKIFSLVELSWYQISISWSPSHGLLVLQGSSLIGSSYLAETLTTVATITNKFTIGCNKVTTSAELHWKSMTIIQLFWQDVKRADLLTATTSVPTTVISSPSTPMAVTPLQVKACLSVSPVGISDPEVIPVSRIITSSDMTDNGKDKIRLNCCEGTSGNAWCPDSADKNPYVEIHLEKPVAIGRIVIQPPTVKNQDTEYPVNFMKSFDLFFKLLGINELATYAQDVNAIVNKTISLNTIWLQHTIVTDVIRIEPRQSENLPCFRMELYTCEVASLCPQDYCRNGGTCSGPNTCDCSTSYFGERCQYTKQTIPKAVYNFIDIIGNIIFTSIDTLTFYGEVTLDLSYSLIIKPGSYIDLSSLTSSSCYADLDSCFSGFTLNFEFSFFKLDTETKVVVTNGAGIDLGIKGITLLFNKGELHCYVVTSTKLWKVIKTFSLLELSWYEISISWSPHHGLLVLQGSSLIGSSYVAETLTTVANITKNFMFGYNNVTTSAELHWKSMTIIQLFWQDVKRADLLTATTSVPTRVTTSAMTPVAVTPEQITTCPSVSPVGVADSNVIPISRIVTSSEQNGHGKDQIRLNCCEGTSGNAWCPDSSDKSPYVEIHLEKPVAIGRVAIQAPTVNSQTSQYPTNFMKSFDLLFKLPDLNEMVTIAQNISAIVNKTVSLSTASLQTAVVTDVIRIEPRESENLPCFRMELYSCDAASLCSKDFCQNEGTCSGPNTCKCSASYFGERCQYTKQSIPKAVYTFIEIIGNTIFASIDTLKFYGEVTFDMISNSLIIKSGSYIDLSSLSSSSCYADLDSCFSGFTLNFVFRFSKLDTNRKVILTNGAGIESGVKGITLMFDKGELHCYVVTSTKLWRVVKSFSLVELSWYEISISWSQSHGLLVLQGSSLISSSYTAQTLTSLATITKTFTIGYGLETTKAELHWKSMTIIQLFWQEVMRADLLTATTSVPTTVTTSAMIPVAVTPEQITTCPSVSPVGVTDSNVIPSSRIVTSSEQNGHGKDQIRFNCCEGTSGNAWCPDSSDKSPYVEIHLEKPVAIGRVAIQAPTVNIASQYPTNFMKSFDLLFKLPDLNEMVTIAQNISAIVNKTVILSTASLQTAVVTDVIRIEPRESENLPCFRMELYSCDAASLCSKDFCQNEGTCSGPNTCKCSASYFGERCQYTKQSIPKAVYTFIEIIGNTIFASIDTLKFYGEVTFDMISNSLIIKSGSYINLSSLSSSSCYADLDSCFSGFTLNFVFRFSKLDTNRKVILTNGAGIESGVKGITLMFDKGELHCYVVTSTKLWRVVKSFSLVELSWYEISISWSQSHGLLVLQGSSLISSSYTAQTLTSLATITKTFTIGYGLETTKSELHWKSMTIIQLFWQEVMRADLLTEATTTSSPDTTPNSGNKIDDHFWNLINITQSITISSGWQLILIGHPAVGIDGIELNGQNQHIEIPHLNNTCLTNPALCTSGLTIEIRIKFVTLEENTVIFTSGGESTDNPGVTLLYRYGFLHAIVTSTEYSWYVSVSRKTIWTKDFCNIIVTWSQNMTLKLIVNEVLIGESDSPVLHTSVLSISNTLTIGGKNTHCFISQLHIWLVHIDILIEQGLISCGLCTQRPTDAPTTSLINEDTTSDYGECPEGCIPSDICFGEQTTYLPEQTVTPTAILELTTPKLPPPSTERTTIDICPSPACAHSTTPQPITPPVCVFLTTPSPTLGPKTDAPTTAKPISEEPTTPKCTGPECSVPTTPNPTLAPTTPKCTGPECAVPTTPNPTLAPTTPKCTGPECTELTTPNPTLAPTTPKCTGPECPVPTTPNPTLAPTTPKCTGPECTELTTPNPTLAPTTPKCTGPECAVPTTPNPTLAPTTPKCTGPECPVPTTPNPTLAPTTPKCTGPECPVPTTPNPTLAPTTPKCTGPECAVPTTPNPTLAPTTPKCTGPECAEPTTPNPTLAPTTPKCTGPECAVPTTPNPTLAPTTPKCTGPECAEPTTPNPTLAPTTPKCTGPECAVPTTPNPTLAPTTPKCTGPECAEPTTPNPTLAPTTPKCTGPECAVPTTPNPTLAPTTPKCTGPECAVPTTPNPTLAPTTPKCTGPECAVPTTPNPTLAPTTPKCTGPECAEPTTPNPTLAPTTPKCTGPECAVPTTPNPTLAPTTPKCTGPECAEPTTPNPTLAPTTPKCTGPECAVPTTPNPTLAPTTPKCTGPECAEPTTPNPTLAPTTPKCTGPECPVPTTPNPTLAPTTPKCTGPECAELTTPNPTLAPTTPKCTGPECAVPTTPNPTLAPTTPKCTGPECAVPTTPNPTLAPTTPKCTGPECAVATTPNPTLAPTTPKCTGPECPVPTTPNPTLAPTTPKCTGPECDVPTTPNPTLAPTTPKCTGPECAEPTTPNPTLAPTTPKCTGPECPVPTTPNPTLAPTTEKPTTLGPKTVAPTTEESTTPKCTGPECAVPTTPTTAQTTAGTTSQLCPPSTSYVTLKPEINTSGQGQLTCSVAESPAIGTSIRFTWHIEGDSTTRSKVIEAPDKSASISVTELHISVLGKKITCTAEIKFLVGSAEWCWPVNSNVVVPSIKCPPVNSKITVIEGKEQQLLQVEITVPPSLLCTAEDNGQCRVEVTTTIITVTSELKCSASEIIPQAVLGVTTIGQGSTSTCGVAITSENWQNAVNIPIKATVDGIKDGIRHRKLNITVRIIGQVSLVTQIEQCGVFEIDVIDKDEVSTCSSVNDPHMKTFDNVRYNNFIVGEFVLLRHVSLEVEVRAYYRACSARLPKGPTCNCGAAVRSGDDVITFDTCDTRQNQLTIFGNSVITVAMFKNGQLTPGTRVLRLGCGQKYEVHLPTGTKVTITATRKPFMNINIQASSYDLQSVEGLCGNYNKDYKDDLDGSTIFNPSVFIKKWIRDKTIFKGVAAITELPRYTYCSCQSGHQPVCRQGLDIYICGAGTIAANDITEALISQAKTPVTNGQAQTQQAQVYSREKRDADENTLEIPDDYEHFNFTEDAINHCTDYLQNNAAVRNCVNNLKQDAVNESINNCAEDLMNTNDKEWANSHVDDLIIECLTDALTNISAWEENEDKNGPTLPDFLHSGLCTKDCGDNGKCIKGICECMPDWTGETCQIGPDSVPSVLPATEFCDIMTSSCTDIPVDGNNFVPTQNLICKIKYLTIGDSATETEEEYTVPAIFINIIQVFCRQNIRLSSKGRNALVTVSNDGITYSNSSYIHVVYKSTCQTCTFSDDVSGISCKWKNGCCIIDNECYSRSETFANDVCYLCNPDVSVDKWTRKSDPNCTYTATQEPEKGSSDSCPDNDPAIIVLGVLCGVLALAVVGVAIYVYKTRSSNKKRHEALVEREGSIDIYRSYATHATSADLTGQSKAARTLAFSNPGLSSS